MEPPPPPESERSLDVYGAAAVDIRVAISADGEEDEESRDAADDGERRSLLGGRGKSRY